MNDLPDNTATEVVMTVGEKYSSPEGKTRLSVALERVRLFADNFIDEFKPTGEQREILEDILLCEAKVSEALKDERPARRFRSPHGEQRYYVNLLQKLSAITDAGSEHCIRLARFDNNLRAAYRTLEDFAGNIGFTASCFKPGQRDIHI